MPIPFFAFRDIYEELARREWAELGALPPFDFANVPLVISALAHPYATAGGREVYPTVPAKASALFRGLVKNHGLRDGNKRLAVTAMSTFLLQNGWRPRYTNTQLYRYALRVARHRGPYPVPTIERWIRRNAELASDEELATLRARIQAIYAGGDPLEVAFRPLLLPTDWRALMEAGEDVQPDRV